MAEVLIIQGGMAKRLRTPVLGDDSDHRVDSVHVQYCSAVTANATATLCSDQD